MSSVDGKRLFPTDYMILMILGQLISWSLVVEEDVELCGGGRFEVTSLPLHPESNM
jgi:hypothetical protein